MAGNSTNSELRNWGSDQMRRTGKFQWILRAQKSSKPGWSPNFPSGWESSLTRSMSGSPSPATDWGRRRRSAFPVNSQSGLDENSLRLWPMSTPPSRLSPGIWQSHRTRRSQRPRAEPGPGGEQPNRSPSSASAAGFPAPTTRKRSGSCCATEWMPSRKFPRIASTCTPSTIQTRRPRAK